MIAEGDNNCKNCKKGRYQDLTGQTNCENCPIGWFGNSIAKEECKECGKVYSSKASLWKHKTTLHVDDKKVCLECGTICRN